MPDILKGPKHVAERIMEEQRKQGRVLNDEQTLLFALWVDIHQEAFLRRPNIDSPYLPLDSWLLDIVVDGGGGCGKTMLINYFLVPICRACFGHSGVVLAAPSNKAARGIGAKTLHSLRGFTPDSSLRTAALALTTQKRVKLERTFLPAGAMLHDESSMLAGAMNHAAALLATYAREAKFRLRREDYARPRERYRRIPVLGYLIAPRHSAGPSRWAVIGSFGDGGGGGGGRGRVRGRGRGHGRGGVVVVVVVVVVVMVV